MGKENFKKQQEIIRMLFVDSGVYSREKFSNMLGISIDSYDKAKLELIKMMEQEEEFEDWFTFRNKHGNPQLKYDYYKITDNYLTLLYRTKSITTNELQRFIFLLKILHQQIRNQDKDYLERKEIKELFFTNLRDSKGNPLDIDNKILKSYLDYLVEVGYIQAVKVGRSFKYSINNSLYEALTKDELIDLYYFVDYVSSTEVPSAQGYLLRDTLRNHLIHSCKIEEQALDAYIYKYNYFGRILDEYIVLKLMNAIQHKQMVKISYYPVKMKRKYASIQNEEISSKQEIITPIRIVYDYHYSRWYLIAYKDGSEDLMRYRIDFLLDVEEKRAVSLNQFEMLQEQCEEELDHSWLVEHRNLVKVKVRFYFDALKNNNNFIKKRVLQQGQWGVISEEDKDSFVFEIEVNGTKEIKPWIRSFGSSAEVIEPIYFREEFKKEWEVIQSYYESF
ncbi:WYL domain-containing protein [Evansella sp. AB-P1]|uniref:WYL domain-containing protein n=1 Tax=Evansella sp. AB-P1 TaxID=3037653 RepID=UPI00241F73D0|nr:WYL domain-containing protein [Evansella sp. AB-P1]MDG5787160.1 WYL domain-containing protein [Evansella sp. AB-P1]